MKLFLLPNLFLLLSSIALSNVYSMMLNQQDNNKPKKTILEKIEILMMYNHYLRALKSNTELSSYTYCRLIIEDDDDSFATSIAKNKELIKATLQMNLKVDNVLKTFAHPSLKNLFTLKHLCLNIKTKYPIVPSEIGKLTSLEVLDLTNSNVKNLPLELKNLPHLKTIKVPYGCFVPTQLSKYCVDHQQGSLSHLAQYSLSQHSVPNTTSNSYPVISTYHNNNTYDDNKFENDLKKALELSQQGSNISRAPSCEDFAAGID